jgi:hypothetical protein
MEEDINPLTRKGCRLYIFEDGTVEKARKRLQNSCVGVIRYTWDNLVEAVLTGSLQMRKDLKKI